MNKEETRQGPSRRARADLHVHSRYSDQPTEWILRRLGSPECFTEPREVYDLCKREGMEFVTITDHDRIEGALEIAHLPRAFISCEVTTRFPEDGCELHCLVFGIDEGQFREIERLRDNVYELREYLLDAGIVHSLAHPLLSVNGRLTAAHFERTLVLFKRFELINGALGSRASVLLRAILNNLTPRLMDELANRYDLDPRDPAPWRKYCTAGSDDHSGLYIGSAYTEVEGATTVGEYLERLGRGEHSACGSPGSSLKLARSLYSLAYRYYRHGRTRRGADVPALLAELFAGLPWGPPSASAPWASAERLRDAARFFVRPRKKTMGAIDRAVVREAIRLAGTVRSRQPGVERKCFEIAAGLSQQLSYGAARKLIKHLKKGRLTESLQSLSSLGPVAVFIAPYLTAFRTLHKDEALHQAVADSFPAARLVRRRSERRVWFLDAYDETDGASRALQRVARLAGHHGKELTIVTSLPESPAVEGVAWRNFPPVGRFSLPETREQAMSFPPFLEILEYCERQSVAQAIVSTPGPMGLVGLAAARLLGLELTGIYQTDIPMHVRFLTASPTLEEMSARYVHWFFGQTDRLYVPTQSSRDELEARGVPSARMRLLPSGVDRTQFGPARRDPAIWERFGLGARFKFLYVGRISEERNLDGLLRAFMGFLESGLEADLVVVGDGPYLSDLQSRYRRPEILFTGFRDGEELAKVYASADLFLYPTEADGSGTAVLEAMASGLPVVVSRAGGSRELVETLGGGQVVDTRQPGELRRAMTELFLDPEARARLAASAVDSSSGYDWDHTLRALWADAPPSPSALQTA